MANSVSLLEAAELSSEAYLDSSVIAPNWLSIYTFPVGADSFTVYRNTDTKTLVFAFKGSDETSNFVNDILNSGSVDWENIKGPALAELAVLQNVYPDYQVVAVGHSLGGSMAQTFALENDLDGYGFNSLPIADDSLKQDYGSVANGLQAISQYNGTFKETNVSGDIATMWYSNGTYLDHNPTVLPSPYSQLEDLGSTIAKDGGGLLGLALFAIQAGRAHSIHTVISALSGNQLPAGQPSTMSAAQALAVLTQAAESNVAISSTQNLSLLLGMGTATTNPDINGTTAKIGNPSSVSGPGVILKVSDSNGGTQGTLNSVTSDVYEKGQLTSKEQMVVNSDGSYDLTVFDPVSNAVMVTAHVDGDGDYKIEIDNLNIEHASSSFQLPAWAQFNPVIYEDTGVNDSGVIDRTAFEPDDWDKIVIEKTSSGYSEYDSTNRDWVDGTTGYYYQKIVFSSDGQPIDATYTTPLAITRTFHITQSSVSWYEDWKHYFYDNPDNPRIFLTPTLDLPAGLENVGDSSNTGANNYLGGQGSLTIPGPSTGSEAADGALQLGVMITPGEVRVRGIMGGAALELTDGMAGDSITIELDSSNAAAVTGVTFADGTTWSITDMLQMVANQNQGVAQIIGTFGADALVAPVGPSYMFGGGGNDTFTIAAGSGVVEIAEQDNGQSSGNILQLTGVSLSALSVTASLDGRDLVLKDGIAGDEIVVDQMLVDPTAGVQSATLSDGTSLSAAQLWQMEMTGTTGADFLVGNSGANLLDGHGGNDLVIGGGGNDTFVFQTGYGHLEIRETDSNPVADNILELGAGISQSSLTVSATSDGTGLVIADSTTGDRIVLDGALTSASNGVQQVQFSDGTSLSAAQLIAMETTGTAGNDTLDGSDRADLFDGKGGNDLEIGNGGNDTFFYQAGYGQLEISEFDWNDTANNVLLLGAGITEASLVVGRTADGTGLVLTDGVAGDTITVDNMLTSSFNGIQSVEFTDGSTISSTDLLHMEETGTAGNDTLVGTSGADLLDGHGGNDVAIGRGGNDTFVFGAGYGQLEVEESSSSPSDVSTLKLVGISEASIQVVATSDGSGLVVTDGVGTDQITLDGMLASTAQGVQQFEFDDGTAWSRSQIIQMETTGTPGNDTLYGSPGAELFDGQGGNDLEVGNGGGDTFVFNQGYGQLEIDEVDNGDSPDNVLQFGGGISESAINVSATSDFTGIVLTDGVGGDQITLDNMLTGSSGGVQAIQFADGTAWSRNQIIQYELANATTGSDTLCGAESADLIDGLGGGDYEQGGGGADTFIFNQGYGQLEINEVDNSENPDNVLKLGVGISESSIVFGATYDYTGLTLTDGIAGDQITLDNMFASSSDGIQEVQFVDGTLWSRSQIIQAELTSGTTGNDTLVGTDGADVFDGRGGSDLEVGNGGSDTFVFNQGFGQLEIDEIDYGLNPGSVLQLGTGITEASLTAGSSNYGSDIVLTDGVAGDEITLDSMLESTAGGVSEIQFADGSTLSRSQIIRMETTGTTGNDSLYGTSGAELFDGKGGQDYEQGWGGNDTFIFNQGYGQLEINESDTSATPDNILRLGVGIDPSSITVTTSNADNLVLTDDTAGDQITLDSLLSDDSAGVQQVQFADGAVWSRSELIQMELAGGTSGDDTLAGTDGADLFDGKGGNDYEVGRGGGDTFVFNQGYGDLKIDEWDQGANPDNVLKLGVGISASSVLVSSNSDGAIVLNDGIAGDQITLDNMSNGAYGVQQVQFSDGTTWSADQIVHMATTGTTGDDTLYGSDGPDLFDGKGGNDLEIGRGGGDTFVFNAGYGHLEVNEQEEKGATGDVLLLGAGISESSLTVEVAADGSGLVVGDGVAGDQITLDHMLTLSQYGGYQYGVQQIQFDDGTTWSAQQLIQLETTGTTGADTLHGAWGDDVFDGKGGSDLEIGNGGNDTYVLQPGYGSLTIENGSSLTWPPTPSGQLSVGDAAPEDIWLQRVGNDLQVDLMGSSTSATIQNWYTNNNNQLADITVTDGTSGGNYTLDSQVNQLVQVMATFSTNNPGFDPTSAANSVATDPTVLATVNAAWHH